MSPEEIRLRAIYLYLACAKAVEQFVERLTATWPSPPPDVAALLPKLLRKEIGLLFRYWATRQIWEQLDADEEDATQLNLALLRLFTEVFKLPKDGTGVRYAELSSLAAEVRELSHRITSGLGRSHPPLLELLETTILPWRDTVVQSTADALALPFAQVESHVRSWVEVHR